MAGKFKKNRTAEDRLLRIEKMVDAWNARLASIDNNMKHYLKARLPAATSAAERKRAVIARMEALVKVIDEAGIKSFRASSTSKLGSQRVLFHCSHNQAAKLRRLLDTDMRNWRHLAEKEESNGTKSSDAMPQVPSDSGDE